MAVKLKRAYEPAEPEDGQRYLVDRLWPRGRRREALELAGWLKDLAPSTSLRQWYNHEPERWAEFTLRYRKELSSPEKQVVLDSLSEQTMHGSVTLVFAARDEVRNEATVLKEVLEEKTEKG